MKIRKDEMFVQVIVCSKPSIFYTEGYAKVSVPEKSGSGLQKIRLTKEIDLTLYYSNEVTPKKNLTLFYNKSSLFQKKADDL